MPRLAANLTTLWAELPFLDRFGAARRAGFQGVEVLFPYDCPAPQILDRLDAAGLRLVLINCPPPSYVDGPRGFAAMPGLEERFRHDFRRAARYAAALGAQHVHVMAGVAEGARARATFAANLAWAAAAAPRQSITIEPINGRDVPGYFLQDYGTAAAVLDEVGAPNLGLQFDAHHARAIEGDLLAAWERVRARVVHVQVAGRGRHEPDDPAFLDRLDADGYAGWVSAEYHPRGRTEDGLGWMEAGAGTDPRGAGPSGGRRPR